MIDRTKLEVRVIDGNSFHGYYDKCEIEITRETSDSFYIQVTNNSGELLYDGYWIPNYPNRHPTMQDALQEAIDGSELK